MLKPSDKHMLAHYLDLAAHYYEMSAYAHCDIEMDLATEYFGKALAIIKSKTDNLEVSEGGRTPIRRMDNDDGQSLCGSGE